MYIPIHVVLPWPTYIEPWAKKVDLEPSPDRASDKINMLKKRRNTQQSNCIVQPTPNYGT